MSNKFSTIACYSVIRAGFSDNNEYKAFLRIVIGLIEIRHYLVIDSVQALCDDFKKEFNFEIPYFPMKKILHLAVETEYLTYRGFGKYYPNYDKICEENFMTILQKTQEEFHTIILSFIAFVSQKHGIQYTEEMATNAINSFIEENGVLFYRNHSIPTSNSESDFLFKEYLIFIKETDPKYFDYIDSLIVGRILSEYITYHEPCDISSYRSVFVYIDTGFAFRLLGIDNLNRKDIYKSLVDDMISNGMTVRMFSHSFNELIGIINSSAMWINNPNYDPARASEATYYFVTNNFTTDEIDEIAIGARANLHDLGVDIFELNYPQIIPAGALHEKDTYDRIVSYYKEVNPQFDEEEKKFTVEQDARSFFYIQYLNQGIIPNQISEIRNIFISTNRSLGLLSKKMILEQPNTSVRSIPFCVTDSFWGTLLWVNTPAKLIETNKNRLAAEIYSAFIPSDSLLRKLTISLNECEAKGTLTAEECYMLKASKLANKTLMELTLGQETAFEDKTPLQVLQDIQEKSRNQGAQEERKVANVQIKERIENNIAELRNAIRLQNDKMKLLDERRKDYQEQIGSFKIRRKDADDRISHKKKIIIITFIGLIVLYIIFGLIIWLHQGNNDILELYQFILPACGVLLSYLYFVLWGRTLNFIHWLKNYNAYNQSKYYKIYDCIPSSMERVTGELEVIEQRKQQADDELHSLNQRLVAFEQEMRDLAS